MSIIDLEQRTNYSVYDFNGKQIVLYDDHRCLLNVLYEAKQEFGCAHDVFYFDNHDDARDLNPDEIHEIIGLGSNYLLKDLWNFVEFTSASDDASWLKAGFELGLIKNAVVFGAEMEDSNVMALPQHQYIDLHLQHHFAYSIKDVETWSRCYRHPLPGNNEASLIKNSSGFILDFDLDCFASDIKGIAGGLGSGFSTIAIPEVLFSELIENLLRNGLMYDFIKKANVITICMEPDCCGGLGESYRILNLLDEHLFDHCLRTARKC